MFSALFFTFLIGVSWGQVTLDNSSPSNTQNFDGMGSSTTATIPSNWKVTAAGSGSSASWNTSGNLTAVTVQASSGSPTGGGRYNWGSSASERSLGFMTSGSYVSPNGIMVFYSNSGTSNINSLTLSYDLERYRINSAAASVSFFFSTDGSTWTSVSNGDISTTALPTGTSSYSFTPSGTPSPTNCGVINKSSINIASLSIAPSSGFYLKWVLNTTGSSSQGIGIDNVVCNATFASTTSSSSNIIANAGFTYPANIDYTAYQGTTLNTANSIEVAQFDIQDGGGSADADALTTELTALTLSVANSGGLRRIALFDGNTHVAEVAGGSSAAFTGLALSAADDGSKTFSVRVSFLSSVTDNQQFSFTVNSAVISKP